MIARTTANVWAIVLICLTTTSLVHAEAQRRSTGTLQCQSDEDCAELTNPEDPCTQYVCDDEEGCIPVAVNCDDGLFCNGVETCAPDGQCVPGTNPCKDPLQPICNEDEDRCEDIQINCFLLTFEVEDDFATPLVNGQDISSPDEFGNFVSINALPAANAGAAVFDSTPGGPNAGGPDPDLLVDSGNVLILQDATNADQTVAGIFDTPDDSNRGGTIRFDYLVEGGIAPLSLVVVDFEEQPVIFQLTDSSGRTRTVTVPTGYTSDSQLDTVSLVSESTANGVTSIVMTDNGFDPRSVVRLDAIFNGSGAIDDILACLNPQCASDEECIDEDPCTIDRCDFQSGNCTNIPEAGCCETTEDCTGDRVCDPDLDRCVCDDTPGCCETNDDCPEDRTCDPTGRCVCDEPDCCTDDDDCSTERACDTDTGSCVCDDTPGCCTDDEDCGSGKVCDTDTGTCVCGDDPTCCDSDEDCSPGETCDPQLDRCVCGSEPACCELDEDCAGNKTCAPDGRCVCEDIPGCCETDADCPAGRVCGDDGRCVCASTPECCDTELDCAGNRSCAPDGRCVCDEPNCCEVDEDCPEGRVCGADGTCLCPINAPGCCTTSEDCQGNEICDTDSGSCVCADGPCNDGNACTANDTCTDGVCIGQFIPGCGGTGNVDRDGDGIRDGDDNCPDTANGPQLGTCDDGSKSCLFDSNCPEGVTCQKDQENRDEDDFGDACDPCPDDAMNDRDGDGVCEADDGCPMDPNKTEPGACGCNAEDTDSDNDGTADCEEACPNNPDKDVAGVCGCDTPDTDTDGDGVADCNDNCPQDADKAEPGICGCGVDDVDADGDGQCDEPVQQEPPSDPGSGPQQEPPLPGDPLVDELPCGCGNSSPLLSMAFMLALGAMKLRVRRRR